LPPSPCTTSSAARASSPAEDIVYAIIFSNFAQAILLLLVGLGFVYFAGYVVRVPLRFLIPTVLVAASFGSYAIEGSTSGPITLFVFAVIGWAMVRYDYPVAATVVGLLLGRLLETQFLRSWQISGGDPLYLLERPAGLAIVALMALSMAFTAWTRARRRLPRNINARPASGWRELAPLA
jgi:putative tricarboxylic transport membrane protein